MRLIGPVASLGFGPLGGANASSYADGPAPSGFHWEFVTLNGARVTLNGVYVVALAAN